MFQILESSGQSLNFSEESVTNFEKFLHELGDFCHALGEATASAIVSCQVDESDELSLTWQGTAGSEVERLENLSGWEHVKPRIRLSLERSMETCLAYCRASGAVSPLGNTVSTVESNRGSSATETANDNAPIVVILEEPSPEAPAPALPESVLWIRPISKRCVLLSICPKTSLTKPLLYIVHNAHHARSSCLAELEAKKKHADTRKVVRLAEKVSSKLPLKEQGYLLANEISQFLDCDRVTIFDVNNSSANAIAVSGQPKFDRRSNTIRTGQNMVGRIAKTGSPFWFSGNFDELADSLKDIVRRYTDESLVNSFVLFPIVSTKHPVYPSEEETMLEAINPGSASEEKTIGAVLVEQIEDTLEQPAVESQWKEIHSLVRHQYQNSRKYDSIFLGRWWDALGRFAEFYRGQTKKKAIAITSAIAIVLLGAFLIPADFQIRCEGYLVFENTLEMYSKGEGDVVELLVNDGQEVKAGDLLVVQRNIPMEQELEKIMGEVSETKTEIESLNDSRSMSFFSSNKASENNTEEIAQKVKQLDAKLAKLERQAELAQSNLQLLEYRAPFDGVVAGWKARRRLLGRPLEKGTHLFSLIPLESNFRLELRVPDQRAGYVQTAWAKALEKEETLEVTFKLASSMGKSRLAHVDFVSPGLERDEHIGYSLPIYAAALEKLPAAETKSRTAVLAKVKCGRCSFAYCKSYEVIDWVKSKIFEYGF